MAAALRAGALRAPAPDFALRSADGATVRLADHRGQSGVVLFFMRAYT